MENKLKDKLSSSGSHNSRSNSIQSWKSSNWQSACYADSSDDEDGLNFHQPFPRYGDYENAPPTEGRGARPTLHCGSDSSAFQAAFYQQQTFWRRKLASDPAFRGAISNCAEIQRWMDKAIARNELNVATIRFVTNSCATTFLEAIGYIEIVKGPQRPSIQWSQDLLEAFKEAGEWYRVSSTNTFWFGQAASIVAGGANVLLEMTRPALAGSTIDKIKLGVKAAQMTWQGCIATPMGPLLAAHEQSKGVKGLELASIPYMPNVSSIDYKVPVLTTSGEVKLESVPYANAKDIHWSLDLIQDVRDQHAEKTYWFLDGSLKTEKSALAATIDRLEAKPRLSRKQKDKLRLAKQRVELIGLAMKIAKQPEDEDFWRQLDAEAGQLKKELALAEIAVTFNSAPSQSGVRAARYAIFGLQAGVNIAGAAARLGVCVPHTVLESASSMAGNVTWAGSQIIDALGASNVTETAELVAECTGFNPWGFALELANFGLTVGNPLLYWWRLPQACADDHMRKVVAYSAALMLQPHGKLTDEDGSVNPHALDQMLRGRMWRVIDCATKALESDLHCPASALMTHIVDFAPVPDEVSHSYEWLVVQFEALKTSTERRHFMENFFFHAGRHVPDEVDLLLQHYEQIIQAIELAKEGEIADLLDSTLVPPHSIELLRSGLTIAAGGHITEGDQDHWKALMKVFGDIEARSFKNGQLPQKAGQALAKKGLVGTAAFTFIKSVIDFSAAVSKSQSTFEHDTPDVIAKAIQLLGGTFALGTAFTGYLVSYCYWQFILEKNRQRQAKLGNKFSPPNSSILNPDGDSYLRGLNSDRRKGIVTNFTTLLAHPIDDSLINKDARLTYDGNAKEVWSDIWAQINTIDLDLDICNLCRRLREIVHPDETLLDTQAEELKFILAESQGVLYRKLQDHIDAQKTEARPTTTTDLTKLFVENPVFDTSSDNL